MGYKYIIDFGGDTKLNIFVNATPVWRIYGASGGISVTGTSTPRTGEWMYVEASRTGSTMTLFVNGSLEASDASASADIDASASAVRIGDYSGGSYSLNGKIDAVVVDNGTAGNTAPYIPPTYSFWSGYSQGIIIA